MTYVELSAWLVLHVPNRKIDNETDNEESPDEDSKLKQKVEKIRKSPFYRGVDLWNTLKVEHHRAENKKRLKLLLKQILT